MNLETVAFVAAIVLTGLAWWRGWGFTALVPLVLALVGNIAVRIYFAITLGHFPMEDDYAKNETIGSVLLGIVIVADLAAAVMAAIGKKQPENPEAANWKSWASREKPQT